MTPANNESEPAEKKDPNAQAMWSFRGYQLHPEDFSSALVEFYRGEVQRANIWRTRLDTTTNWAVLTTAATILFTFANPGNSYIIIILCTFLVTFCLTIEARRYRYYELWSYRVRLMETDFFAAMLVPPFSPSPEWAESLAESLLQPHFSISLWEALGRRFRRNYLWLFIILGATWALKLFLHPTPALNWSVFVSRAAMGLIPGWTMILLGLGYNALIFIVGFATAGLRKASGEVLPKFGDFPLFSELLSNDTDQPTKPGARPAHRRQQVLSFIITAKPENISTRIIREMKRGVTGLHGQGMYTHTDREVLMVAVMVTEVARLKALVQEEDPNAFVAMTHAQAVFGRGFQNLNYA
ncbi:MAG TPA: DUF2270 domain-containing protein [Anaerolineales bacterium]|nr:DUF2270 domain-containing protein [Anaerolineales bacterium]